MMTIMSKFDDNDDNTKDWIPLLEVHLLVFLPLSKSPPFPLFRDGLNEQPKNYELVFFIYFISFFFFFTFPIQLDRLNQQPKIFGIW